jgi:tetratricopeptide (TPR) repeat protein
MAYTREIEKLKRQWDENPKGTSFAPLAELYRKDGQHEKALEVLKVGLESNPKHIPGNIVMGRCCLDLKLDAEAEVAFRRALELDPENVIALKALADITERAGRLDEATIWLQQLVAVDPSNDDARDQFNRVSTAMRAPEPEPEAVAEEAEPLVGFQSQASQPEAPAGSTPPAFDEPFTIEARPPAPFSVPSAPAPPLELTPPPAVTGFESSEFDSRAAAEVKPQGIPGMAFEHPPEEPAEPLIGSGSAGGGGTGNSLDVALDKAEEIVLRPSSATEFQTDSASEDMAKTFKVGTASEFQTSSASEDMAAAFAAEPPAAVEPPPIVPPPAEDVSPVASEYSPSVSMDQWAPPGPPKAVEPAPVLEAVPEPMAYQPPATERVPESFVFAAPEPEPAPAEAAAVVVNQPVVSQQPPVPEPAPPQPATAQPAEGLRIIYPPTPSTASEAEEAVVGGEPEPVVTETMAELYLRQGLRHEALRVYRLLADRAPGDLHLRERVAQLEADLAQFSANRRAAAAIAASATGGESVGALFQGLLGSPVGASGAPVSKSASSVEGPAPTRSGAPTRPAQDSLSLSAIFGEDTSPVPPTVGAGGDSPSGTPSGLSGGGVSFDQFFGEQAAAAEGSTPGRRSGRAGGADEDLDQFQNWLKSLKR